MAEPGNGLLSELDSDLFVSDKKGYLEKIVGVGNNHLTPIDEQQMAVLLLVQHTNIVNYLSCAVEKFVHYSAVGFDNIT